MLLGLTSGCGVPESLLCHATPPLHFYTRRLALWWAGPWSPDTFPYLAQGHTSWVPPWLQSLHSARSLLLDLRRTPSPDSPVPASHPPRPDSLTFLGAFLRTQMASQTYPALLAPPHYRLPSPCAIPPKIQAEVRRLLLPKGGRTKMFTWKGTWGFLKFKPVSMQGYCL